MKNIGGGKFVEDQDFIFAMSTLWYDDVSLQTVNKFRGEFIRASQKLYPIFEGGLFYIPGVESIYPPYIKYKEEFKDVLTNRRISMKEYLDGTKRSAVVFNTPSVCQCHGWKLAEYLAMGKAIISTPLVNVMPGDFNAEEHYLEANSADDMEHNLKRLRCDDSLRESLKSNARRYFDLYLSPESVVKRILLTSSHA